MTLQAIADSIKTLAAFAGVIVIAYSGFMLITSRDIYARAKWKQNIEAVVIGLSIVFLAPLLASFLTGGNYCG